MIQQPGRPIDRFADAVAYVCGHLEEVRTVLADHQTAHLDEVLQAIEHGQDLSGPLQALHEALLAMGDHRGVFGNRAHNNGRRRQPLR